MVPMQSSEQSSSEDVAAARSVNAGYKLVIDKNVKPRHMRSDNQTRSLHYMQSRTDSTMSASPMSNQHKSMYLIFSLQNKTKSLKMNFAILVS